MPPPQKGRQFLSLLLRNNSGLSANLAAVQLDWNPPFPGSERVKGFCNISTVKGENLID